MLLSQRTKTSQTMRRKIDEIRERSCLVVSSCVVRSRRGAEQEAEALHSADMEGVVVAVTAPSRASSFEYGRPRIVTEEVKASTEAAFESVH